MVIRHVVPITSLLVSFMVLCFGHGLQSVLLPARATLEQFSAITTGLLMSAYYIGFIIGIFLCPWLIMRIGHIRVFAAAAASASAIMLLHALSPYPLTWVLLRVFYGLAMVQLYTVMESWLNTIVEGSHRGRVLSIYMIINFIGMAIGQLLFFLYPAQGFELFAIASIMLSLSLLPLILSVISQPALVKPAEILSLKRLFALSPLGVAGALIAGLAGSAYWGLTARFMLRAGYTQYDIALFMALSFAGGLVAQWPLGVASDRIGRRIVIIIAATMVAMASLFLTIMAWEESLPGYSHMSFILFGMLFGAGLHPLYSLCIAHTNDFVGPGHFVRASTGLQLVQSVGAVIGPLLAGFFMYTGSYRMLFVYIGVLMMILVFYALYRMVGGRPPTRFKPFRLFTRLGLAALRMDPRTRP